MILTKEEQELIAELEKINKMTHYEMAYFVRFAPLGHNYLDIRKPFYKYFDRRFYGMGGMTLELSQQIGWPKVKATKEHKEWEKKLES